MIEILSILAVWRLSSLFCYEEGLFSIFERIRKVIKLNCFWCYSVWIAAFISYIDGFSVIHWLAYSAGAIILEETICLVFDVRSGS